jgi:hypothetical protein
MEALVLTTTKSALVNRHFGKWIYSTSSALGLPISHYLPLGPLDYYACHAHAKTDDGQNECLRVK